MTVSKGLLINKQTLNKRLSPRQTRLANMKASQMLRKVQILDEEDEEGRNETSQEDRGERDSIDEHNFAKAMPRYDETH